MKKQFNFGEGIIPVKKPQVKFDAQFFKDTAEYNYKLGYEKARQELIKEFNKDLDYINTVTVPSSSPTNVFTRINEIMEKWRKQ